jgi:PPOX class probable F420-dependent enzyme
MTAMDLDTALDFVRSRHQGVIVTLKRDGRPQLSNVAYHLGDDNVVRISITNGRAKTANMRRDDRVSFYVTRDDFWAYVVLEGEAELAPVVTSPDDATADELVEYFRAISGEHPDWDEYRRAMVTDERLVVRFRASRAYGMLPS